MKIRRQHELGLQEVKRRIDKVAIELSDKFQLRYEWQDNDLRVRGSGLKGRIAAADQSVEVRLELGLALRLFEGAIRSSVEKALDEHLA